MWAGGEGPAWGRGADFSPWTTPLSSAPLVSCVLILGHVLLSLDGSQKGSWLFYLNYSIFAIHFKMFPWYILEH